MTGNRMCAFALSTAFAIIAFTPPAAAAPFGSWNMALVTTSGHCGVIKIGMAVNGGHISATSGRFVMHKISLSGLISGSGATKIDGVAGPRVAKGRRTLHAIQRQRQVERYRTFGRLLGNLDRRSLLNTVLTRCLG